MSTPDTLALSIDVLSSQKNHNRHWMFTSSKRRFSTLRSSRQSQFIHYWNDSCSPFLITHQRSLLRFFISRMWVVFVIFGTTVLRQSLLQHAGLTGFDSCVDGQVAGEGRSWLTSIWGWRRCNFRDCCLREWFVWHGEATRRQKSHGGGGSDVERVGMKNERGYSLKIENKCVSTFHVNSTCVVSNLCQKSSEYWFESNLFIFANRVGIQ